MATPDQITALRRGLSIMRRQAPNGAVADTIAMRVILDSDLLADRLVDALLDEGFCFAGRTRHGRRPEIYFEGYDAGYVDGYNAGLAVPDPTNPTSEEDTHNEL